MLGYIAKLIGSVFGNLYPAYATYKAVVRSETDKHRRLLMFWTVNTILSLVDYFGDPLLSWLPLFYVFKAALIVFLTVPDFEGSQKVYNRIAPYLNLYEPRIDEIAKKAGQMAERGVAQLGERSRGLVKEAGGNVVTYVTNNCGPAITHLQTAALNALTPALNRFSPNPALNESVPLNNILHESKFSDPQPSANAVPDPVDVDNNGKEKVA